jgi:hypothetical protein
MKNDWHLKVAITFSEELYKNQKAFIKGNGIQKHHPGTLPLYMAGFRSENVIYT